MHSRMRTGCAYRFCTVLEQVGSKKPGGAEPARKGGIHSVLP